MSGNQVHDRAASRCFTQEGGGAAVEPGEGTDGQVHDLWQVGGDVG